MTLTETSTAVELVAEFTALPGCEDEVERLLRDLTIAVRAEPGCLVFDAYVLTDPPAVAEADPAWTAVGTRFVVVEAYRNAAAFAEHLAQPHGAVFNAALGPLIAEANGSELRFLRRVV
ncbi:putative quinol monooxygenase [Agromyces indicus]|uniref:Quinol monooxygenase n=1 Tax=Agromyces indicus TaxID=758919 RepID=A0ABU1FHV2_9MICO|nr:putative quinol monooxygenase [Agromyces indicus]MDR5691334.1 putative quinol monooxygenase [Agromyces indicus]